MTQRRGLCAAILMYVLALMLTGCGAPTDAATPAPTERPAIAIEYFHETVCGSCDGDAEFRELFQVIMGEDKDAYPYRIVSYNVFQESGRKQYDAACERYGFDPEYDAFPMLFLDGVPMVSGEIKDGLHDALLARGEERFGAAAE